MRCGVVQCSVVQCSAVQYRDGDERKEGTRVGEGERGRMERKDGEEALWKRQKGKGEWGG